MEDGRWKTEVGRWKMEVGRPTLEDVCLPVRKRSSKLEARGSKLALKATGKS
jgi:hypothetical protein